MVCIEHPPRRRETAEAAFVTRYQSQIEAAFPGVYRVAEGAPPLTSMAIYKRLERQVWNVMRNDRVAAANLTRETFAKVPSAERLGVIKNVVELMSVLNSAEERSR